MTKTSIILGLTFTCVFAAGILFGLAIPPLLDHGPGGPRGPEGLRGGPPRLDLTRDQREAIDEIWRKAYDATREPPHERDKRLLEERDHKTRQILNDHQQADFDRIRQEHSAAIDAEEQKRRETIANAIEQTRALLNDEQRRRYDEMRNERRQGEPPGFAPYPPDERGGGRPGQPPPRDGRGGPPRDDRGGPPPFGGPPPPRR